MFGAPPGIILKAAGSQDPYSWKSLNVWRNIPASSKEDRIIILMGNHESRCTLDSILYVTQSGITSVTFPPHCSHRLQPLDVGVMGPFRGKLRVAQHDWMTYNPGKVIKNPWPGITDKCCVASSFYCEEYNRMFAKRGTWPFSRLAFSDTTILSHHLLLLWKKEA